MAEELYDRTVYCEIGVPGEQFRRFEDLRISARVRKGSESEPNSAEIDIFNVSADSISSAQDEGAIVRLFAGYSTPRLAFTGSINPGGATQSKDGTDRLLEIEAKDGGRAFRSARINKTFDRGTRLTEVLDEINGEVGLPDGAIEVPEGAELTQGVTLTGPIKDVLPRLNRSLNVEISIQDRTLQVLPPDGVAPDEAILVSSSPPNRNLIGEPRPTDDGLEVTAYLDGRFLPGQRIRLESRRFEGLYRIVSLEHSLDSGWDQAFYSELTCREV